jgi:hypothetical protein
VARRRRQAENGDGADDGGGQQRLEEHETAETGHEHAGTRLSLVGPGYGALESRPEVGAVQQRDGEERHNEFVDSIDIPPATSLVYRVRMDDRPFDFASLTGGAAGRWAMHCHILFHAGIGMISEFVVKATP